MLPGQLSFEGIPGPEPKLGKVEMMPIRSLVELCASLPPYRPSTPEEIAERRRRRMEKRAQ